MTARRLLGGLTALLAWTALIIQFGLHLTSGVDINGAPRTVAMSIVDYFGYFTILTNLLVAIVLTGPMLAPGGAWARWADDLRTTWTTAAAILVVGVAYHVLLSATYDPVGLAAVTDLLFHYIVPALYVAYWIAFTDVREARWPRFAPVLSVYPTAYFTYLVVRGQVIGTYPYFFVDVRTLGLLGAFRNAMAILAFYLFVAWVIALVAGRVGARRGAVAHRG